MAMIARINWVLLHLRILLNIYASSAAILSEVQPYA